MKILTVSASPYLFTRLGRINRSLMRHFQSLSDVTASVCWHLDPTYYTAEDDGKNYFEGSRLYPVDFNQSTLAKQVLDAMKDFQPDVVVSIGDLHEMDFISSIKSVYPALFKWVAIVTRDGAPLTAIEQGKVSDAEEVLCTSEDGWAELKRVNGLPVRYAPVGHDVKAFYPDGERSDRFTVCANLKNAQISNLPAFFKGISVAKWKGIDLQAILHTNVHDRGDYDLQRLIDDYNVNDFLTVTNYFSTVQEAPDDNYLRNIYSKAHLYIDTAMRSYTAMGMVEAMACGCVPICSQSGAQSYFVHKYDKYWDHLALGQEFIGERHHSHTIVGGESVYHAINRWYDLWKSGQWKLASEKSIQIAQRYTRYSFEIEVDKAIGRAVGAKQLCLAVDELV